MLTVRDQRLDATTPSSLSGQKKLLQIIQWLLYVLYSVNKYNAVLFADTSNCSDEIYAGAIILNTIQRTCWYIWRQICDLNTWLIPSGAQSLTIDYSRTMYIRVSTVVIFDSKIWTKRCHGNFPSVSINNTLKWFRILTFHTLHEWPPNVLLSTTLHKISSIYDVFPNYQQIDTIITLPDPCGPYISM